MRIAVNWREGSFYLKTAMLPLLVVTITLVIYLSLLSTHYDPNGIVEVVVIERGEATELFWPHHILYRPLGYLLCKLLRLVGYDGLIILPLQALSAFFGALGVGVFFTILRRLTDSNGVSLLVTAGYAFSYGYWIHSEDVYYIIPATFFVLLAFRLLVSRPERRSGLSLFLLAFSSALAILFWQTNVFFVPVVALGLVLGRQSVRKRRDLVRYLLFLAVTVGTVYLSIGAVVVGCRSLGDFVAWLTTYSTRLPMWGVLDPGRVKDAALTLIATFIPLKAGLGLRSLSRGEFIPHKLLPQFSLGAMILLFSLWGGWAIRNWGKLWNRHARTLSLVSVWIVPYVLFNTWWDPYEVKWWIIPTTPMWTALALVMVEFTNRATTRRANMVVGSIVALVIIIGLANFSAVVWARHAAPNPEMDIALWVGSRMSKGDLLVAADWGWSEYVPYFAQRDVLNLTSVSAQEQDVQKVLRVLDEEMARRWGHGARVFFVDIYGYTIDHWAWLTRNTGLVLENFTIYERRIAWEYRGEVVWEIVQEVEK
jgi:hypothetical protein